MTQKRWGIALCLSATVHLMLVAGISFFYLRDKPEALAEPLLPIEVELGEYNVEDDPADAPVQAAAPNPRPSRPAPVAISRLAPESAPVFADTAPTAAPKAVKEKMPVQEKAGQAGNGTGSASQSDSGHGHDAQGSSPYGGAGRLPYVIEGPPPPYPEEARLRGWEGTVRVRVLVLEKGTVGDMAIVQSSGYRSVDQSAVSGLRRWRFSPAYQGGRPVPAWVVVPVVFQLE
ncbi:energy transducer TonB [Sporomusa termitida]|uniref:TonB C-terminal domain-containing protein n=1 Tax=Sporomusa termitida TaxID=2377 RepID=A0A517DYT5_9FIRM|nr:energy transducer TonB [Sporomusa termitida]QDR82406.1 hypothetical protein SPTER_38330 [Sporomusa termitida]